MPGGNTTKDDAHLDTLAASMPLKGLLQAERRSSGAHEQGGAVRNMFRWPGAMAAARALAAAEHRLAASEAAHADAIAAAARRFAETELRLAATQRTAEDADARRAELEVQLTAMRRAQYILEQVERREVTALRAQLAAAEAARSVENAAATTWEAALRQRLQNEHMARMADIDAATTTEAALVQRVCDERAAGVAAAEAAAEREADLRRQLLDERAGRAALLEAYSLSEAERRVSLEAAEAKFALEREGATTKICALIQRAEAAEEASAFARREMMAVQKEAAGAATAHAEATAEVESRRLAFQVCASVPQRTAAIILIHGHAACQCGVLTHGLPQLYHKMH